MGRRPLFIWDRPDQPLVDGQGESLIDGAATPGVAGPNGQIVSPLGSGCRCARENPGKTVEGDSCGERPGNQCEDARGVA